MRFIRSRLTSAHLIALLALFVALGGSAYAVHLRKGAVKTRNIKNGAVVESKLANGAVTDPKIATGAVTNPKIVTGAVTNPKIATGAVTSAKIAADAVTGANLAAGAVGANGVGRILVRSASKPLPDGGNAAAIATCAPGERLIGGSGDVNTSNSQDVVVNGASPSAADGSAVAPGQSPSGWTVLGNNYTGGTFSARVIAYALCLK